MINLGDSELGSLSKETILRYVTEYDIFRYYLPYMKIGQYYSTPWRRDSIPSFSYTNKYGFLMWKDFGRNEKGNWISLVKKMENVEYKDVFNTVAVRLQLPIGYGKTIATLPAPIEAPLKLHIPIKLGHNVRAWNNDDQLFWEPQMISKATLTKYDVSPISALYIGESFSTYTPKRVYVYREQKDNILTYKYYNPTKCSLIGTGIGPKIIANNNNESIWEGWSQLPKSAPVLIISKSRKEVMCIDQNTKYASAALQAECVLPKPHIVQELKERFPLIFVWYDPDDAGILFSSVLAKTFGFIEIHTPKSCVSAGLKDLTEMTPLMGYNAFTFLHEIISTYETK